MPGYPGTSYDIPEHRSSRKNLEFVPLFLAPEAFGFGSGHLGNSNGSIMTFWYALELKLSPKPCYDLVPKKLV